MSDSIMNKLFCDLKTDEEKSLFFLSGRAYKTGIITHAAQNDVAMAYHRCSEYEKEVATLQQRCEELEAAEARSVAMCDRMSGEITQLEKENTRLWEENTVLQSQLAEREGAEPVAWQVSGPYERSVFKDKSSAEAFCRGLNEGYGQNAYSIDRLYTATQPAPVQAESREFIEDSSGYFLYGDSAIRYANAKISNLRQSLEHADARAVKAEEDFERLCNSLNEMNGPTFMGEPVQSVDRDTAARMRRVLTLLNVPVDTFSDEDVLGSCLFALLGMAARSIERLKAPVQAVPEDAAILDWLEMQCIAVRTPAAYGSFENFTTAPEKTEDGNRPNDLRAIVRHHLLTAAPSPAVTGQEKQQ